MSSLFPSYYPITQSQVFIKHLLCARCCSRAGMLAWAAVHGKDLALALREMGSHGEGELE